MIEIEVTLKNGEEWRFKNPTILENVADIGKQLADTLPNSVEGWCYWELASSENVLVFRVDEIYHIRILNIS